MFFFSCLNTIFKHIIDNIDEYICDANDISDNCICNDKTLYDGAIWQESLEAQSNRIAGMLITQFKIK